jgi:diguanylate cyclase (GGDEF)-like protein
MWGPGIKMSRVTFNRNRVRLKKLLGIRAGLSLLALILVAPLMLERARSLEDNRAHQIALASAEFSNLAQQSADAQREVISSVEALLKSTAYIRASAGVGRSCEILRSTLSLDMPWIRSMSIVAKDGLIQCSTLNMLVGLNIGDREHFKKAQQTQNLVFSDFLLAKSDNKPIMAATYPVSAISSGEDSVVVAAINLDWMSKIISNLGGRPGISAVLIDSTGTVLAAPSDQGSMVGRHLDSLPQMSAITPMALTSDQPTGTVSFASADGTKRAISFFRIPGTPSRLIASVDEVKLSAAINRDIRTAYLQLGFVCLFVLLGALVAGEKLIIQPIGMISAVAKQFGQGDWSVRAAASRLPAEFMPLARTLNAMAAQLSQRERELVSSNDRLTVIASMDMVSGLANRRGFQSRLDFEWLKAQQSSNELSLLMIDVDHFKLFNDTYGHLEGDTCLGRVGEALARIAVENDGFAARYGGEEFCLLLPEAPSSRALEIGEKLRSAVQDLSMPHRTSSYQTVTVSIGVSCTRPSQSLRPSDLIEAADAALYAAKHRGRNTVVEHGFVRTDDGPIALVS